MIHYHGLPITGEDSCLEAIKCGHAFVSFRSPEQLGLAVDVCQSFAVDNGAFTAWKSGNAVTDWSRYYEWVARLQRFPTFDFAVIPDVIDGDEIENDALVDQWPWKDSKHKYMGAPVWHMHESIGRLEKLSIEWPRICIGSSGDFATVGNSIWWTRMSEAMNAICDKEGNPVCKIHGLRMLDIDVFSKLPLSSADSTNIARNVGIDKKWNGSYTPASKKMRAAVMRDRIESHQSLTFWQDKMIHPDFFELT